MLLIFFFPSGCVTSWMLILCCKKKNGVTAQNKKKKISIAWMYLCLRLGWCSTVKSVMLFRAELYLQALPCSLQWQGFSPWWILWCTVRRALPLKLSHPPGIWQFLSSVNSLTLRTEWTFTEGFPTLLAFEQSLSCMNSLMLSTGRAFTEGFLSLYNYSISLQCGFSYVL